MWGETWRSDCRIRMGSAEFAPDLCINNRSFLHIFSIIFVSPLAFSSSILDFSVPSAFLDNNQLESIDILDVGSALNACSRTISIMFVPEGFVSRFLRCFSEAPPFGGIRKRLGMRLLLISHSLILLSLDLLEWTSEEKHSGKNTFFLFHNRRVLRNAIVPFYDSTENRVRSNPECKMEFIISPTFTCENNSFIVTDKLRL